MEGGQLVNGSLGVIIGFTDAQLPIVRFAVGFHGESVETVVEFASWDVELPTQNTILTRTQLPLILAYAM